MDAYAKYKKMTPLQLFVLYLYNEHCINMCKEVDDEKINTASWFWNRISSKLNFKLEVGLDAFTYNKVKKELNKDDEAKLRELGLGL